MDDMRSILDEAVSRGANADQVRQIYGRLQANQPAGQPTPNGESPAPNDTNISSNQQVSPMQKMYEMFSDKPGMTYGNILPLAHNEKTDETTLATPEFIRSPMRGLADLMAGTAGERRPVTDTQTTQPGNLSTDSLGALMMMSPMSAATRASMKPMGPLAGNMLQSAADNEYENMGRSVVDPTKQRLPIISGLSARDPETLQQTASNMKSAAGGSFNQMREIGATFNPQKIQNIAASVDEALAQKKMIPALNPKTLAIVDDLKSAADSGQLGLSELEQYQRLLGRVGDTEDGVAAGAVKKAIQSHIDSTEQSDLLNGDMKAVQLLAKGRADYSTASRFEEISDILAKANGDPNRIKAGLQRFVADSDNLRGYTNAQIMALRKAANTGVGENILKALGKFGVDFSKSGVGNTVLPAIAGFSGLPGGIPLAIGGTIARQGQKYIARGKAENALKLIERGRE